MRSAVLKGFSFEVKPGQKVACVGRAGCGKSTSIGLLQRLYDPDKGSIYIDNLPISAYDVHYLRRCTGIVAQDNVLFATSIKENICYGMGQGTTKDGDLQLFEPTDDDVWEVCRKANATEFIHAFPNKLNTMVGERGVRLSGGQIQRIGIARALFKNSELLILDEPTSSLDNTTESLVIDGIKKLKREKTIILISHRVNTLKNCDKIYEVKDKKISEVQI